MDSAIREMGFPGAFEGARAESRRQLPGIILFLRTIEGAVAWGKKYIGGFA